MSLHRMPFGKFRGRRLTEVPDDYLSWLADLEDLREPLRAAINQELERRRGPRCDPKIAEDIVARGQRSLAKRAHPDCGGSHEQMIAIRTAVDWLLSVVTRELRA